MKKSSKFFWIYFFFLTFFFANILFLWIDQDLYEKYFFGEDRIVEWLTFTGFFGAALTCIIIIDGLVKAKNLINNLIFLTKFLYLPLPPIG